MPTPLDEFSPQIIWSESKIFQETYQALIARKTRKPAVPLWRADFDEAQELEDVISGLRLSDLPLGEIQALTEIIDEAAGAMPFYQQSALHVARQCKRLAQTYGTWSLECSDDLELLPQDEASMRVMPDTQPPNHELEQLIAEEMIFRDLKRILKLLIFLVNKDMEYFLRNSRLLSGVFVAASSYLAIPRIFGRISNAATGPEGLSLEQHIVYDVNELQNPVSRAFADRLQEATAHKTVVAQHSAAEPLDSLRVFEDLSKLGDLITLAGLDHRIGNTKVYRDQCDSLLRKSVLIAKAIRDFFPFRGTPDDQLCLCVTDLLLMFEGMLAHFNRWGSDTLLHTLRNLGTIYDGIGGYKHELQRVAYVLVDAQAQKIRETTVPISNWSLLLSGRTTEFNISEKELIHLGNTFEVCKGRVFEDSGTVAILRFVRLTSLATAELERTLCLLANVWRNIYHCNLVGLLSYTRAGDSGQICLVVPWCENRDVIRFLGANPYADRIQILLEVARCLDHLLIGGITVGRLKPSNILIGEDGRVQLFLLTTPARFLDVTLLDFIGEDDNDQLSSQNAQWTAPELLLNESLITEKSTVYSWAMSAVAILIGQIPFPTGDDSEFLVDFSPDHMKNLVHEYSQISGEYADIWVLLESCLEGTPDRRPSMTTVIKEIARQLGQPRVSRVLHVVPDQSNPKSPMRQLYLEDKEAELAWKEKWYHKLHNCTARFRGPRLSWGFATSGPGHECMHTTTLGVDGQNFQATASRKQWSKDLAAKRAMQALGLK